MANGTEQQRLENRIDELTSLVRQLVVTQHQVQEPAQVCGICSNPSHYTNVCPSLYENTTGNQEVAAAGVFPGKPQQQYNPYSNTYNPGWRDHPNLRWGNSSNQQGFQQQPSRPPQQQQQPYKQPQPLMQQAVQQAAPAPAPTSGPSLEDLVKQLATNNLQFQQRTEASIQTLQTQIGQLAFTLSQVQSQESSSLPSQTIPNPKGNVSAITLRSGIELQAQKHVVADPIQNSGIAGSEELDCDVVVPSIESECTNLITAITHTSDFVQVQAAKSVFAPTRLLPSIVRPPTFELKPLPKHLEYAHLEDDGKLPVIISTQLDINQEEKLIQIIRKHKMNLEVIFGKFNDLGEMVEHDPSYHLIIVQPMKESLPPEPPPDFKIGVFIIFNHRALMLFSFLGFYMGLRQTPTQITVHQDYELPLSARNPLDPD